MEARNFNYDNIIEEFPLPKKKKVNGTTKVRSLNRPKNRKENYRSKTKNNILFREKNNRVKEILIVIFGCINLSLILLTLYSYITMNNINIEIANMNKNISDLETLRDEYKMEVSNYMPLDKVEEVAKFKLGMIFPDENQSYYISTNKE